MRKFVFILRKSNKDISEVFKKKTEGKDPVLGFLKKLLIYVLDKQGKNLQKSKALPVGHTSFRKDGNKYKKIAENKWRRLYEGEGNLGEKQAVNKLKKRITGAQSVNELVKVIMQDKKRFLMPDGKTNPVVMEVFKVARDKFKVFGDSKKTQRIIKNELEKLPFNLYEISVDQIKELQTNAYIRNKFIVENQQFLHGTVYNILNKFKNKFTVLSHEDAVQEANIKMMQMIADFSTEKSAKMWTDNRAKYKAKVEKYKAEQKTVKNEKRKVELKRLLKDAENNVEKYSAEPTPEKGFLTWIKTGIIRNLYDQIKHETYRENKVSLETPISGKEGSVTELGKLIEDVRENPDINENKKEKSKAVQSAMAGLKEDFAGTRAEGTKTVLQKLSEGMLPKEIEKELKMSPQVMHRHLEKIRAKAEKYAVKSVEWVKLMKSIDDYLNETKKENLIVTFFKSLNHKYVKRTGTKGKYKYWYKDPKTGKLVEGKKDKIIEKENKTDQSKLKRIRNQMIKDGFNKYGPGGNVTSESKKEWDTEFQKRLKGKSKPVVESKKSEPLSEGDSRIISPNEKTFDNKGDIIRPGDYVIHSRFGKGVIDSIDLKSYSIPMITVKLLKTGDKIYRDAKEWTKTLDKRGN